MKRSRWRWSFIGLGIIGLLLAGCAGGGGMKTASLKGVILDQNGEPFLGEVLVEIDGETVEAKSGQYVFTNIQAGKGKDLKATSDGYFFSERLDIQAGENEKDIKLVTNQDFVLQSVEGLQEANTDLARTVLSQMDYIENLPAGALGDHLSQTLFLMDPMFEYLHGGILDSAPTDSDDKRWEIVLDDGRMLEYSLDDPDDVFVLPLAYEEKAKLSVKLYLDDNKRELLANIDVAFFIDDRDSKRRKWEVNGQLGSASISGELETTADSSGVITAYGFSSLLFESEYVKVQGTLDLSGIERVQGAVYPKEISSSGSLAVTIPNAPRLSFDGSIDLKSVLAGDTLFPKKGLFNGNSSLGHTSVSGRLEFTAANPAFVESGEDPDLILTFNGELNSDVMEHRLDVSLTWLELAELKIDATYGFPNDVIQSKLAVQFKQELNGIELAKLTGTLLNYNRTIRQELEWVPPFDLTGDLYLNDQNAAQLKMIFNQPTLEFPDGTQKILLVE